MKPKRPFTCFLSLTVLSSTALAQTPTCGRPQVSNGQATVLYRTSGQKSPGGQSPLIGVVASATPLNFEYGSPPTLTSAQSDSSGLANAFSKLCGAPFVNEFGAILGFVPGSGGSASSHVRGAIAPAQASASSVTASSSGQASQALLVVDLDGDGTPDNVYVNSSGLVVQLVPGNGVVVTYTYPLGFTPNPGSNHIIAADFNGDGKIDLAISDPGNGGSNLGSIAVLLGNGDGKFQPARTETAGPNPMALAAADFNGDGKMDLAVASQTSARISILAGKGDGTFGTLTQYATGGAFQSFPSSILALDLNGDGLPDLAIANHGLLTSPDSSFSVLINSGTAFGAASVISLPLPLAPDYLAYADLNHDGKIDLVGISKNAGALMVLPGNGNGTFQATATYATGNSPASLGIAPLADGNTLLVTGDAVSGGLWLTVVSPQGAIGAPPFNIVGGALTGIAVADMNGDGQPDAVVVGGSNDVSVLLSPAGQFTGGFHLSGGYSLAQTSPLPQAVAVGDLNHDGKLDVVVASTGLSGRAGVVSVLLGNGDGTLQPPTNIQVNQNAQSIALADVNGDGKLDVIVAAYGSRNALAGSDAGGVLVLLGKGDGTFQAPLTLLLPGLRPEAVATGDLNGDGIPDVAAVMASTLPGTTTLAVFLSKGDGTFQTVRTFPMTPEGGTLSSIVIHDFNGDGKADIAAVSNGISSMIDILLGDGAGNFHQAPAVPTSIEPAPVSLAVADVDGDGRPDLILAHCCGQTDVTFLLGNGDGTFQAEQQITSGLSPMGVTATEAGGLTAIVSADNSGAVTAVPLAQPKPGSTLTISANVSAASASITSLAPNSIVSMYGSNLATGTAAAASASLPDSLLGTSLLITDSAGNQRTAPLYFVSPLQLNYLIPADVALGAAQVSVTSGNGAQGSAGIEISNVAPGIFTLNPSGLAAAIVVVVGTGGSQTFRNIYEVSSGAVVPLPIDLSAGKIYLELFGTGIRNASRVAATVRDQSVPVLFAGAQGAFVGLDQVNIGPLPQILAGQGQVTIVLTADGQAANTVNVTVK